LQRLLVYIGYLTLLDNDPQGLCSGENRVTCKNRGFRRAGCKVVPMCNSFHSFIYLFRTTEIHRHTHKTDNIYRKRNTQGETERKKRNTLTKHVVGKVRGRAVALRGSGASC